MGERSEMERQMDGVAVMLRRLDMNEASKTVFEAAAAIAGLREACEDVLRRFGTTDWSSVHDAGAIDEVRKALAGLSAAPGREGVDGGHDV